MGLLFLLIECRKFLILVLMFLVFGMVICVVLSFCWVIWELYCFFRVWSIVLSFLELLIWVLILVWIVLVVIVKELMGSVRLVVFCNVFMRV